ncbi:E3 ubiquitin-protein ligase [Panicum miliaceum]|uniref:RING-type E3 ubiquitin transferase n=1 Tax=Panicum miliaceum TaxID=4540 RepID=A0A3L6RM83_PANMI|nr:E3 ubiquitin-protein ligase [Panicum miliaceum]
MDMAEDCVTRVCALAIATTACVGFPGALVYAIVRTAAARRFGTTAAFSVVLVFWVTVSAAYYPRVCADVVRGSALMRRVRGQRARPRRPCGSALLPRSAVAERQGGGGGTTTLPQEPPPPVRIVADADGTLAAPYKRQRNGALVPLFVTRGQEEGRDGGMTAVPQEIPAARGGERVVVANDDTLLAYERRAARAPRAHDETSRRCAVCLRDVEKGEVATWLPTCLHVFHQHCIDQWLHLHGHPTCPICRSDAFVAPPLPHQGGHGGMTARPLVPPPPPPPPPVRGGARVVAATLASYERQRSGASLVPPPFVARGRHEDHRGLTALPREPPAARVVAADVIPASSSYERRQPDDGETSERCAVCLCDVEKQGETCPICRSDAFVAPPLPHQGGHGGMTARPLVPPPPPPPPPPPVRGGARVVAATLASYERQRSGASLVPPPFVARGRHEDHRGLTALPREPPAARVVAADVIPASSSYERRQPDDGETSERCAVCLCDVEKQGETATWLPACLHVFHQHCIDQWLHLHGHSTCPICRSDAFVTAPPPEQTV